MRKAILTIISMLIISSVFIYSQDFGTLPPEFNLTEKDSLKWPIKYQIELAVNDLRSLQVKSENYYTKFQYAYYSKFDSIYITELKDTIFLYPDYEIGLIYPESDFLFHSFPAYDGKILEGGISDYQWTADFEGILPIKWNLRDYPFDSQMLKVQFITSNDTSRVLLSESEFFKSKIYIDNMDFLVDGYEIKGLSVEENFKTSAMIADFPDGTRRNIVNSILVFNIEIDRKGAYLYFKLFFGAFLSYIISLLVFFIDKKLFETRITLSLGGIFGAVGNKYFVENSLPELLVLTKADIINNMVIVFIILNIFLFIAQSTKKINLGIFEQNNNSLYISLLLFIISNILIIIL